MRDPRFVQLAQNLVDYSIDVQAGDKVLIDMIGEERELLLCLIDAVYAKGGMPFVELEDKRVTRRLLRQASEDQIKLWAEYDLKRMEMMDAYVGIRSGHNVNELSDVPGEKSRLFDMLYKRPIHSERRVKHTKWVVMRYPNASMAQLANMSTEAFEDFYFNVCNLDYRKMSEAMDALAAYMEKTDRVRLVAPNTDLTFSIKGIPAVKCDGKLNIPDGEVFTAPVRDSVNGEITFNVPSIYSGTTFENIYFRFENGRIVDAACNETERLLDILDTDEGARYIGEFSLGINPFIQHPMKDILFDEKIDGSLHFTPGQAYEEADNGNRSSIHWDLVLIQRPDYGGGDIYFDDLLIRKDGRFVVPELEPLNPENLK
ncbi:aminopeptidase [Xylanibacillus composti]|uniref:Aminopeptidase n=1 Tax=Xylanibacillus composti TaxID=1572762 RepID=A0A8J4H309_9BACL|nr:aminopeptidase [Xylanibacillus composti]MDT9724161.1 aminopeptidase [Xylanibacillus composti]GIQ68710.1 aminopeptidase [Xylanibacillus composti]